MFFIWPTDDLSVNFLRKYDHTRNVYIPLLSKYSDERLPWLNISGGMGPRSSII